MDIHRCRFVQYPPQPINAVAFSRTSDPGTNAPPDLRLALGRNNGDIEIWNPAKGLWVQEITLKGNSNTTVEQLAWTQDLVVDDGDAKFSRGSLRLFSTGGSTAVTEWDLCTGIPKRKAEGNFGDIWCLAPQPQLKDKIVPDTLAPGATSQMLAAGCSDGTIILFSTEDDDLRYVQALAKPPVKKPKVLSLAWRDRNTLVAGYEDSTIRIIDIQSRRVIRNMSLGKAGEGNNSIVWSITCLPDGTIVSGDSSGELKIWDSKNFSLVQRLECHKADILDIATSASGDTIFSVGVDRRTVTYKKVPIHSGTQKTRWGEVLHRRYHQHDVKCVASFEAKDMSFLVSGGMDTRPVVVPIRRFQTEYHRGLPHLPQRSQVSASGASRLLISWWNREIAIYHVRKYQNFESDISAEPHYDTLARLELQDDANIQDAKISQNGQFIVAATSNSVRLFQLRRINAPGKTGIRTRQIDLPVSMARLGARQVGFSPDGKWLWCVRKDNAIALSKIIVPENSKDQPAFHKQAVKLYRQSRKSSSSSSSALGSYEQTVTQVAFSPDSRVLAVGDLSGFVDCWILEGHEELTFIDKPDSGDASDSSSDDASSSASSSDDDEDDDSYSPIIHGQKWKRNPSGSSLPQLDSSILALTFRPSPPNTAISSSAHDNLGLHPTRHTPQRVAHELPASNATKLIAITATHQLVEFDVLASKLSDWSRRNPSTYLPQQLTRIKDRVVGCFWDAGDAVNRTERLWLYGSSWLAMLDVSKDLPREQAQQSVSGVEIKLSHDIEEAEKIGRLGKYDILAPVVNGTSPNKSTKKNGARGPPSHEQQNPTKKRKRNTGAGDEIRLKDRDNGMEDTLRRFQKPEGEDTRVFDIGGRDVLDVVDDDQMDLDEDPGKGGKDELALLRRGEEQEQDDLTMIESPQQDRIANTAHKRAPSRTVWHTFEYKSILGISVIGSSSPSTSTGTAESESLTAQARNSEHEGPNNIEVVIVERPLHEVEQAPRFEGGQDWDV